MQTAHALEEEEGSEHHVDRGPVFRCEGVRMKPNKALKLSISASYFNILQL